MIHSVDASIYIIYDPILSRCSSFLIESHPWQDTYLRINEIRNYFFLPLFSLLLSNCEFKDSEEFRCNPRFSPEWTSRKDVRRDLTREKRNPLAYELDTRVPPHSTHDGFSFRRYSQFVVYERSGETGTGTVLLVSPWRNGDSLMARPGDWMRCDGNFVGKSSAIFQRAKMTDRILDTRPPLQCFAQG